MTLLITDTCQFVEKKLVEYLKSKNNNKYYLEHYSPKLEFVNINYSLPKQYVMFSDKVKSIFKSIGCILCDSVITKSQFLPIFPSYDVICNSIKIKTDPIFLERQEIFISITCVLEELNLKNYMINILKSLSLNCNMYQSDTFEILGNTEFTIVAVKNETCQLIYDNKNSYHIFISDKNINTSVRNVNCIGKISKLKNQHYQINANIIGEKYKQQITVKSCPTKIEIFYNYDGQVKLISRTTRELKNDTIITTTNFVKNDLLHETSIDKKNILTGEYDFILVNQCMITNGSTGLRYRGKFKYRETNGKYSTTHAIDDRIIRHEEDKKVIMDEISEKKNKKEDIIGWKTCKNNIGEFRIVKLKIPKTANYLMAIDSEYFMCFRKHRSNVAIVLDIQEPTLYEEKSVVDIETSAYSCVFEDGGIEYKLGEIVESKYDTDMTNGCSEGIHWYKERKYAFKHIPEFEHLVSCKYD